MTTPEPLPIVSCGDPVLRRPAGAVDPARLRRGDLARLITGMRVTMEAAPGVGLAAPQIGEPLQLAVLADDPERWDQFTAEQLAARERSALPFTVLVNPELSPVDGSGMVSFYEGCLSVPGLVGVVARHRAVRVDALDARGEPFSAVFSGWPGSHRAARDRSPPGHLVPRPGRNPVGLDAGQLRAALGRAAAGRRSGRTRVPAWPVIGGFAGVSAILGGRPLREAAEDAQPLPGTSTGRRGRSRQPR